MLEEQTKLTLEELAQRQDEIRDRLQEIHTEHPAGVLPPALQDEWDALIEERDLANKPAMQAARTRLAQVSEYADERARQVDVVEGARVLGAGPTFNTRRTNLPDNLHDIAEYRTRVSSLDELPALYREGAMHVVERSSFPHPKADREDAQGHIERLLGNDSKDGEIARRILATGSPAYDRAYGKMVMGRALTADEQRQLASFSGSDADGGYAVPFTLDPTVILTSDGQVNPLRQIARLIQLASGNTWKGVRSAGVTASYDAEGTETTDDSPSLEQPELTVDKAQAFVPFTIEIDQDWPSLRSEIAMMIQEAKDELEADKFLTGAGHGSKEPEGLLVGSTYHVSTGSSNALTVPEDLSLIMGDLPARFRGRASWVANLFFYNTIRAGDDNGTLYVKLTEGVPGMLMGRPAYEASEMAAALTDGYEIAVYGDFSKFAIVDKIGLNTELIPHLFKTARNYPSGERGLYAYWRNTSGVLVDKAFRKLAVKS